jgi:PAS domain S-box-containing protein
VYQAELEKVILKKTAELQESEAKYRNLIEQTLVGVFIQQKDKFSFVNRKTSELLECKSETLLYSQKLLDFVHPDDFEKVDTHCRELGHGTNIVKSISFRILTAAKNERILEMWADIRNFQGTHSIEGFLVDITEQQMSKMRERHLELQLLNEHKLAAIGRLTAGISHNLNTPISIIQGNAELLKIRQPDISESEIILRQTARMSEIIQTISKKGQDVQNSKIVDIDIDKLLQDELVFLNANLFFKHHVKKEFFFDDNLPLVNGQYSDISQGILYIIQNAIDAVYESEVRKISISTQANNDNILIIVKDSGTGIREEDKAKVFSPFFTTKPKNIDKEDPNKPRGTGLGLSLAKNSLSPYGASIEFDSVLNEGTTFTIKIPHKQ